MTHHRGPWRWFCCLIWPLHCNDMKKQGYAVHPSFSVSPLLHLWTPENPLHVLTVTQRYMKNRTLDTISLRYWAYGPERATEGRESGGEWNREGVWRKDGGRSPGKANNFQQSCSVPEVPDQHLLPHTGLVILFYCVTEIQHDVISWPTEGKQWGGGKKVCDTHLAGLVGGPRTLMI